MIPNTFKGRISTTLSKVYHAREGKSPPRHEMKFLRRVNLDLLLLVVLLLGINIPYFSGWLMPAGDSKPKFAAFYYWYNHFYCEGELPRWSPYGAYGMDDIFDRVVNNFLPFSYPVMVVGGWLGCRDVLGLFKITLLGQQLVALLGIYLLARALFAERLTVFLVSATLLTSSVWHWMQDFEFTFFAMLSLPLYCWVRFWKEGRSEFIWAAGSAAIVSALGIPTYVLPAWAVSLAVFGLLLLPGSGGVGRTIFTPSWRNLLALVFLLALLAAIMVVLGAVQRETVFYNQGREGAGGTVPLSQFLQRHAVPGSLEVLDAYLRAPAKLSLAYYIGLWPLAGLLLGVLWCRASRWFLACAGTFLFLLTCAWGGSLAYLLYQVPTMAYFRPLVLLLSPARLFLLLAGGFGLEELIRRIRRPEIFWGRFTGFHLAVLFLVAWGIFDLKMAEHFRPLVLDRVKDSPWFHPGYFASMTVRMACYLLAAVAAYRWWRPGRSSGNPVAVLGLLAAAILADGLLYQGESWFRRARSTAPGVLALRSPRYLPRRTRVMDDWSQRQHKALFASSTGSFYAFYYNLYQHDPVFPEARSLLYPAGVDRLLRLRGGRVKEWPNPADFPWQDGALLDVLGARQPKLRLLPRAYYARTEEAAARYIQETPDFDQIAVLSGTAPEAKEAGGGSRVFPVGKPGSVISGDGKPFPVPESAVKKFNANRIELELKNPFPVPAWLVYADSWHPGWQARVDGQPARVAKAYLAFKAVRIPPGKHAVALVFDPQPEGWVLAALTLATTLYASGVLVMLIRLWRQPG